MYSINGCKYCVDAKNLIKEQGFNFKEILLTGDNMDETYRKIDSKTNNYRFFPMIFKGGRFIGGYKELKKEFNTI